MPKFAKKRKLIFLLTSARAIVIFNEQIHNLFMRRISMKKLTVLAIALGFAFVPSFA